MKILRLKLCNFIGILHGLGKTEIELDFTKSKSKMVMLLGGNGSGKSTILSQLQPYKDSFDDRKSLIIDGTEGRKEIDILSNGSKYEIIHIYAKTAQSFIKKDGIELNENGGVRTFEDIISKELGISKDYFAIGKIGSNTKNFVEFTSTERKSYVGNFLNIEEMLAKFKIVNEKLRNLKKETTLVASELNKYGDKSVIETEINQLSVSAEEIDKELSKLYTQKGSLETEISRDKIEIGEASLDNLKVRISEKTSDVNENSSIKKKLENELNNIDNAENEKELLSNEITEIQTQIQVNNSEQQNKQLLITDSNNKISATRIELNSLANPEELEKIINEINELEKNIERLSEKIKSNKNSILVKDILKEKKDFNRYISKFIDFTDFIEKYFTDLSKSSISANKKNIEFFFDDNFEESFRRQVAESRNVISSKQKLLVEQIKDRTVKEGHVCQLENLKQRPSQCSIDTCPFIKEALLHKNVLNEIAEKDSEIAQTKKDIELLEIKAENLQAIQNLYLNFLEQYKQVQPRENTLYTQFISEKSLIDWVSGSLFEFQSARQNYIESLNEVYENLSTYISENSKLRSLNETKKVFEDSDSNLREKYENDIKEQETKIEVLNSELNELKEKGKNLTIELESKRILYSKFTEYLLASSKLASAQTMLSSANSEYQRIFNLVSNKNNSESKLQETSNKIQQYSTLKRNKEERLSLLKKNLDKVTELSERMKNLEANYKPVESIANALSPSSGIPLVLIKTYLEETESIANDLLDIAFNGDFQIKFVTTEKEFSIQVISKDNIKPDIKMASQGEIAITTISISLALIEQSIGEYNILCLDEIDGPLDSINRSNFIDILNNQIQKLGIEQVFIISHNNAFDTAEMGLVLLKGNNIDKENSVFMENKTIIFEAE